jgi:hypothetical protein
VQVETELVRLVLAGLAGVIAEAERRYMAFNADFPDVITKAHRPRIWVCREFMERDGLDRWAFASGISDAPDWTICIEFRGLEFLEIWAGD